MHELGVTRDIAEVVLKHAIEAGAAKVIAVNLIVGEMRNLEEPWVQRYFRRCARGTIAEDAVISITYVPIAFYCNSCGETFTLDVHRNERMHCPACHGADFSMVTGKELTISSIELEY